MLNVNSSARASASAAAFPESAKYGAPSVSCSTSTSQSEKPRIPGAKRFSECFLCGKRTRQVLRLFAALYPFRTLARTEYTFQEYRGLCRAADAFDLHKVYAVSQHISVSFQALYMHCTTFSPERKYLLKSGQNVVQCSRILGKLRKQGETIATDHYGKRRPDRRSGGKIVCGCHQ